MLDNLKDDVIFHAQVLDRFTSPIYIAIAGLLVAIIGDFIFTKLVFSIYNSKFLRPLIEKNIDAWSIAGNLVPVIIILASLLLAWQKHQSNIKRFIR